jgi:hypothetical protein
MLFKRNHSKGLIKTIILIIISLIILGIVGLDLEKMLQKPTVQNNLDYGKGFVTIVWENYLKKPVMYIWDKIIIGIMWRTFSEGVDRVNNKDQSSRELDDLAPAVPGPLLQY